jgi:hypothetical protein
MRRHLRVVRKLARDPAIPRWLRLALLFGLLPIPGPVDDVVVIVVALVIVTFYRHRVRHHYAYEAAMVPIAPVDTWGAWA